MKQDPKDRKIIEVKPDKIRVEVERIEEERPVEGPSPHRSGA